MLKKIRYSKESRKRINSLILLICFTMVLLIAMVYAWFSTQKNVSISNLKGKIEVAEGLKISLDADIWGQSISFGINDSGDLGKQTSNGIQASWNQYDLGIQKTSSPYQYNSVNYVTNNIRPILNYVTSSDYIRGESGADTTTGYLIPISCAGALTEDSKGLKFFKSELQSSSLKNIIQSEESINTGMYAFDVYLMNTTKGNDDDQLYLNYDSIVREIKQNVENRDYGLKNCVRVGLAFYEGEVETTSSKDKILENINNTTIRKVAIWEPNYDTHSGYAMQQNSKLKEIAHNAVTDASPINSVFIENIPVNNTIVDIYTTDSSIEGLAEYTAVRTKGEIVTALLEETSVSANASGIQKIKDISGDDVKLTANKISKLRVYIWLEGQDPDCINWASHSDGIDVNIGLTKAESGKTLTEGELNLEQIVPVTGVSLNKSATTIVNTLTEQLIATIEPSNASNKNLIWSSSDTSVAVVDQEGNVTIVNAYGTAIITVTTSDGNFQATCEVTASCFAKGTKITMANGLTKNIEDIEIGDNVLTFNHEAGLYESQEVYYIYKGKNPGIAFTLNFDNGKSVSIVGIHDLFVKESLKYVSITEKNAESFIGKYFYSVEDNKYVKLDSVTKEIDEIEYYSIYVKYNENCIANGMISVPDDVDYKLNIYDFYYDLTVNHEQLEQDIIKYGLFDFCDLTDYTIEEYEFMNLRYLNICVGKGLTTWERIFSLKDEYLAEKF